MDLHSSFDHVIKTIYVSSVFSFAYIFLLTHIRGYILLSLKVSVNCSFLHFLGNDKDGQRRIFLSEKSWEVFNLSK